MLGNTNSETNNSYRDLTTYHAASPNMKNTVNLRVKYGPQHPISPRFQAVHFSPNVSNLSCLLDDFLMPRISDAFHSGPNAGTVINSTGPDALTLSSGSLYGVGDGTCR